MKKNIVILGASGGCLDVLNTINQINTSSENPQYNIIGLLDDKEELHNQYLLGIKVLGGFSLIQELLKEDCFFVTALGNENNHYKRGKIINNLGIPLNRYETIIHPSAIVSDSASLGRGCVLHQNVVISTNVNIKNFVLILANSVVNHDVKVNDYTIINSSVSISGGVIIESASYIGALTAIKQNIVIGEQCLIGMGSVVTKSIKKGSIALGVPAKVIRQVKEEV